jgi:hypothetical membrane protein
MSPQRASYLSILATMVFWPALLLFGAIRPDYSQFTRAVSALGAIGAPNALAWNMLGFIAPGLLLAWAGTSIAESVGDRYRPLWWLFLGAGAGFAGTGVFPAVMVGHKPIMDSPLTMGHVVMSLVAAVCWLAAAILLYRRLGPQQAWRGSRAPLLLFTALALVGYACNLFHDAVPALAFRPGLAQRISFGGEFLWYVGVSVWLQGATMRLSSMRPQTAR